MNASQLINQDSQDVEYYTPEPIVEAARRVLGDFDLDPATSEVANKVVKAKKIFTIKDDALKQKWFGRVWMNHPFSRQHNAEWIRKLVHEFTQGHVKAACCICFASTSERWFTPLLFRAQCFLIPRTNYYLPGGGIKTGVTKGSVVTYFGRDIAKFAKEFRKLGVVKVAYRE